LSDRKTSNMKTNSTELFDLIKSLNRQEKKRVRKELSLNKKDKKLLILYDIIDKQKTFNNTIVQKKSGSPKWYPQLKQYLLEKITDNVYSGHYDKQTPTYILKLITVADLLYKKGLIKQAQKKLEQATVSCKKNNWIECIPIVNARLSNIITLKQKQNENYIFYTEDFSALNQFYLEKKYSIMFRCLEFSNNTTQAAQFINDLRIDEYLSDEKHLTTLQQKLHYYSFLISYYTRVDLNYSQSYLYSKKYLEVLTLQSNEKRKNNDQDITEQNHIQRKNNIIGLLNVITAAINGNCLADLDELFRAFIRLEKKLDIEKDDRLQLFYNESFQLTYFVISAVNITRRGIESSDFNRRLNQYYLVRKKMSHKKFTVCDGLIAICFFMKKNWKDCLLNINTILNDNELYKFDQGTYSSMMVLQLFVNYETEDIDSLDYNLKKTERYFENHYSGFAYEKIIVTFFNEMVTTNYYDWRNIMEKYKDKLNYLLLNDKTFSLTYMATGIFIDFECWLISKITNRSFMVVLQDKAKKMKAK
jgi:hypothetical protein